MLITKAKFWDKKGEYLKSVRFKRNARTFEFNGKTYGINLKASHFDVDKLFYKVRYYFYSIDKVEPIYLDYELRNSILKPDEIYTLINTKQLIKLNNLGNKLNLNLKTIGIIAGIGIVAWLVLSGNLV